MTANKVSLSGSSKIKTKIKVKRILVVEKIYFETPVLIVDQTEELHECIGSVIFSIPPPAYIIENPFFPFQLNSTIPSEGDQWL